MTVQGAQAVVFVDYTEDLANRDRKGHPARDETRVKVLGCSVQPAGVVEHVTETDYSRLMWHCLAPAVPASVTLSAKGFLYVDDFDVRLGVHTLAGKAPRETAPDPETGVDTDYAVLQVLGTELFTDVNSGAMDHVTVHAKSEMG